MTLAVQPAIRPRFHEIDGLAVRMAESERQHIAALLLSPWPESLYAYEPTWSRLAEHAHLVAVDLPGFGHSERRDALMSPKAMGEFIVRIADKLRLEKPHVVAPDVGTSAALFAASTEPRRFSSLVVGTGATAFPLQLGGVLKEWVEAPDIESYRQIDGRKIVEAAMSRLERYELSPEARQDYLTAYQGQRFFESMPYVRTYPEQLPLLRDVLPTIETPVLAFAGSRDSVVPPVNAEYLVESLPHAKLAVMDTGHFAWEDAADAFATLVARWWTSGHRAVMSR